MVLVKLLVNQQEGKCWVNIHQTTEFHHDLLPQSIFCGSRLLIFASFLSHEGIQDVVYPIENASD